MSRRTKKEPLFIRIMKLTVKAVGLILVFGTTLFFLWRAFISTIVPSEVDGISPNGLLKAALESAEGAGEELLYFRQAQEKTTLADHNYSYFTAHDVAFIEDANQIQVLFRYNNSTIRHLVKDYNLPEMPDRTAELYDVTLYVAYDLTPADLTDNAGNDPASVKFVRYHASSSEAARSLMYNYRRLTFDGLDMTVTDTPVLAVYVDVYYLGDLNYEAEPYGTICIYDYLAENTYGKLTNSEIAALEEMP